ncbi:hypothetical protein IAR50_005224 [Cryptococcus sp. DSM 104548]
MTSDWKSKASAYKQQLADSIPSEWKIDVTPEVYPVVDYIRDSPLFSQEELSLLKLDATALRDAIASREYTSSAVVSAYAKSAAIAQQSTNCLFEYFPQEAKERAKWLDEQMETKGPVGPLHGVPISVKRTFGLSGHYLSCGFLTDVNKPVQQDDSVIISILRAAGAVFMVTTAIPQSIMHLETSSFLGPALNPHNPKLTPGGSSGGESALIAAGGSVLGMGSDIGGSIRAPSGATGLYGFKPTSMRLPKTGGASTMSGQECIAEAFGPLGRSPRDLELFISTILVSQPWLLDPTQVAMPWAQTPITWKGGKKPRVGIMWDDGVVVPQPPVRRAMGEAKSKLEYAGFEVVDFQAFRAKEAWELISSLYFTDGGDNIRALANESGEPLLPFTEWIISQNTERRTVEQVFNLVKTREAFRLAWNKHFQSSNIDVILSPVCYGSAQRLGTTKYWSYTAMYNIVDIPAGVFPTGLKVDPEVDDSKDEREYLSGEDEEIATAYDPKILAGAPLSLQVAGGRWEDEKVLKALEIISEVVRA